MICSCPLVWQRGQQIVDDGRQCWREIDFYNSAHPDGKPIQVEIDFRDDVAEGEFSGQYPRAQPR
jgi:hypothetical protein